MGNGKPITLLVAPRGWGKTWASAQAAHEHQGPATWLTCTSDHTDPERFASELWDRLRTSAIPLRSNVPRTLERLAVALPSNLDLLLIVDEAEYLSRETILTLMRGALAPNAPYRLILNMRRARYPKNTFPGIPTHAINLLTTTELAFSKAEVIEFAGKDSPALKRYDSHSGWPVAIAALHDQGSEAGGLSDLIRRELDSLPTDVHDLLVRLSPANVWSEALADRLVGCPPENWQATLVESALPLHQGASGELRPHALVRQSLLKHLKQDLSAYRVSLLAAADYALLRHETRTALGLLLDAEAWHQLARVLETYLTDLVGARRWREVVAVMEPINLDMLPGRNRGYLMGVLGIAYLMVARDTLSLRAAGYASSTAHPQVGGDPRLLAGRGEGLVKRAIEQEPSSVVAHAGRVVLALYEGDVMRALEEARAGWDLNTTNAIWQLWFGVYLTHLTSDVAGAEAAADVAYEVQESINYGEGDAYIMRTLKALEFRYRGIMDLAELEHIRTNLHATFSDPPTLADNLYLNAFARAMIHTNRIHELLRDLEALRSRTTRPNPRVLQLLNRYRGIAHLIDGNLKDGLTSLRQAHQLVIGFVPMRSRTIAYYVAALIRAGKLDEAEREISAGVLAKPLTPLESAHLELVHAALAYAKGDAEAALTAADRAGEQESGFTSLAKIIHATYTIQARSRLEKDAQDAVRTLERVLAKQPHAAQRFWWLADPAELHQILLEQHPTATHAIAALSTTLLGHGKARA